MFALMPLAWSNGMRTLGKEVTLKLNREQFESLALEQLDTLYRIARRLVRQSAEAEDLVQETYTRAIRAWESFQLESYGMRPWLVRIMHNVHLSRAQREGRQPGTVEDAQLEMAAGKAGGAGASGGAGVFADRFDGMDQQLKRAMGQLAPEYQVVLLLWAVDDLSYKEIAEAVGIPIGTVMSRLYRARQQLSEQLHDYAVREGIIRE
jgi:RNA polymerase sigma-70 factor (ECF subfamily)